MLFDFLAAGSTSTADMLVVFHLDLSKHYLLLDQLQQHHLYTPIVEGCTNPSAMNYNPAATVDDGSCLILGCMDSLATNYNPEATLDDGSCEYGGGEDDAGGEVATPPPPISGTPPPMPDQQIDELY